jgi:hypothetical protein
MPRQVTGRIEKPSKMSQVRDIARRLVRVLSDGKYGFGSRARSRCGLECDGAPSPAPSGVVRDKVNHQPALIRRDTPQSGAPKAPDRV